MIAVLIPLINAFDDFVAPLIYFTVSLSETFLSPFTAVVLPMKLFKKSESDIFVQIPDVSNIETIFIPKTAPVESKPTIVSIAPP